MEDYTSLDIFLRRDKISLITTQGSASAGRPIQTVQSDAGTLALGAIITGGIMKDGGKMLVHSCGAVLEQGISAACPLPSFSNLSRRVGPAKKSVELGEKQYPPFATDSSRLQVWDGKLN